MKFKALVIAAALVVSVLTTSETVSAHPGYSGPCHAAVDTHWPASLQSWAHRIVQRESRGIPTAANKRSSARGCFQMLLRYSSPFYRAVGCSNYNWSNANCNVKAAYALYKKAGARPWRTY